MRKSIFLLACLALGTTTLSVYALDGAEPDEPMSVSVAREGFTPAQAEELAPQFYDVSVAVSGGDASLFGLLNYPELSTTAVVAHTGPVMELEVAENPAIGNVRFQTDLGDKSLDEYLSDPQSRVQGFIVVHRGRVVYEQYPGMRPNDYHMWMSTAKTTASLMVRFLEEEGLIDVSQPLTDYLPWLEDTGWEEVKVIDVLDMKSGLNILEDRTTRVDPGSIANRMLLSNGGLPYNGVVEKLPDVIASADRVIPPGQAYKYSSINTLLLVYLAEAVSGRRWNDLFHERVWSKMEVEGDMIMGVNSQGLAIVNVSAGPIEINRNQSGLADLYTELQVGLVNAPGLNLEEFVRYMAENNPRVQVRALLGVTIPSGEYSTDRLVNIGSNRWAFRGGVPIIIRLSDNWRPGNRTTLEFTPVVDVFTDNNSPPLSTVELLQPFTPDRTAQNPLFRIETHLTQDLGKQFWASFDSLYVFGGATYDDGVGQNDQVSLLAMTIVQRDGRSG